ncbi:MAG: ubiquinol-cytochrome c reductase cytochrome c subunit [Actinomycetota bacterium]|nr:ubiquinol-cytochrome c reductase cytochrome c subunit [Actinomycetota bacterium]
MHEHEHEHEPMHDQPPSHRHGSTRTFVRLLTTPLRALSRRRRSRFAPLVLLLLGLAITGGAYAAVAPPPQAEASTGVASASIKEGRQLYLKNCSSCHGLNAEGTSDGPSLVGVGAAAVDFQVGTGRMPARQDGPQIQRKRVEFTQDEINAMAAYVASLGPGPAVPDKEQLDYADADAAEGGAIYRTNCSMCHNFAGKGGALSRGKYAPSLDGVSPKHIYEAMLTGPQSMPVFGDGTMPPEDKKAIIKYLKITEQEASPGGASLGKIGPVTEGAVGWLVGLGALIACAVWLGAKAR